MNKKKSKYDTTLKLNGTFEELVKVSVQGNPQPKKKSSKTDKGK